MWTITNISNTKLTNKLIKPFNGYLFYTDDKGFSPLDSGSHWLYSGYIFFRDKYSSLQNSLTTIDLIEKIFNEQKGNFINYIKGNFVLIHLTNDAFSVYSDHFAVKKYFYWHQGTKFIVSSDIREILKHTICQPSPENIARYALTYHFTGGTTLYRNIFHNEPAEIIEFNNNKFEKRFY